MRRADGEVSGTVQWSLARIVLLGTGLALLLGYVLGHLFAVMVGAGASWKWPWAALSSTQLYDVIRSDVAAVALVGAGGAAFIAYRKQLTEEGRQRTAEKQHMLEVQQHDDAGSADLRNRYATAAEQLGHDKAAVRLAGVYAMADVADNWARAGKDDQLQVCVDVLCSYLRMAPGVVVAPEEKEVRASVLSVLGRRLHEPSAEVCWSGVDINLRGAHLIDASFRGSVFAGRLLTFKGATFEGVADFAGATFLGESTSFAGAQFEAQATFSSCRFDAGSVDFSTAEFKRGADFSNIEVRSETLQFQASKYLGDETTFRGAVLAPTEKLDWSKARFQSTKTNFERVQVTCSGVDFSDALFSGEDVSLENARFRSATLLFSRADFSTHWVGFELVDFDCHRVIFDDAVLAGPDVSFIGSVFGDQCNLSLDSCTIATARVRFRGAAFLGGQLHLRKLSMGSRALLDFSTVDEWDAAVFMDDSGAVLLPPVADAA